MSSPSIRSPLRWLIFAFTAWLGIELGAATFVTVVIFPLWATSPEAAIGWNVNTPYIIDEGRFFIVSSPLLFLLAIATLIAGWRAEPSLRRWLRVATVIVIIVFVLTMAYFVPAQIKMQGEAGTQIPAAEFSAMLWRFEILNWIRQAAALLAFGVALHALGLSYRATDRRGGENVPTNRLQPTSQ